MRNRAGPRISYYQPAPANPFSKRLIVYDMRAILEKASPDTQHVIDEIAEMLHHPNILACMGADVAMVGFYIMETAGDSISVVVARESFKGKKALIRAYHRAESTTNTKPLPLYLNKQSPLYEEIMANKEKYLGRGFAFTDVLPALRKRWNYKHPHKQF